MKIISLVLLILLCGCAAMNKPTPEQLANANYGSYPSDYKDVIQNYFARVLIDPYSAVYSEWRGPAQGYVYDMSGVYFGYRVCVEVNAKNRMGGYTGSAPYFIIINNGHILKSEGGWSYGTIGAEKVNKACQGLTQDTPPPSTMRLTPYPAMKMPSLLPGIPSNPQKE